MVATATMIEGSLDVLSCATLMQLAVLDLPDSVNGAIVVFSLLELVNACQSFALQVLLSGGHDDTPLDLVKWKGESLLMIRSRLLFMSYYDMPNLLSSRMCSWTLPYCGKMIDFHAFRLSPLSFVNLCFNSTS